MDGRNRTAEFRSEFVREEDAVNKDRISGPGQVCVVADDIHLPSLSIPVHDLPFPVKAQSSTWVWHDFVHAGIAIVAINDELFLMRGSNFSREHRSCLSDLRAKKLFRMEPLRASAERLHHWGREFFRSCSSARFRLSNSKSCSPCKD